MAAMKAILFFAVVMVALFAISSAEERVKKDILYTAPFPYAAYPYHLAARTHYPYVVSYADDGSYFPGKYDAYY